MQVVAELNGAYEKLKNDLQEDETYIQVLTQYMHKCSVFTHFS